MTFDERRDVIRSSYLEPLVSWITAFGQDGRNLVILDFGCGDGLLADHIGPGWTIDGFDIDLRQRRAAMDRNTFRNVFDSVEEIPEGKYDAIVISSVLQYMGPTPELTMLFNRLGGWLTDDPLGVIITDVVVDSGLLARTIDAVDLIRWAIPRFGVSLTIGLLLAISRQGYGPVRPIDGDPITFLADRNALVATRLPTNLSPFTRRESFHLTPTRNTRIRQTEPTATDMPSGQRPPSGGSQPRSAT